MSMLATNLPGLRRQALGLLVVAFAGVGLLAARPAQASTPPRPITWLAAGDSYSSGHGTPGATDPCNVSSLAWPVRAQSLLGQNPPLQANGFRFAACSGATTPQFASQAAGGRYDLITFTFGGDDIGFADIVKQCVALGGGGQVINFPWLTTPVSGCPPDSDVRGRISALAGRYRQFLTYVAGYATSTGGNIVVLGYPQVVAKPSMWSGVADVTGLCNGINSTDANLARGWDADLNATIAQAVHDLDGKVNHVHMTYTNVDDQAPAGWTQYLFEPPGASQFHTLCGNDVSWLNGLQPSKGFHPNTLGLEGMANLAMGAIRRLDWAGLNTSSTPTPPTSAPPGTPAGTLITPGARSVILAQGPAGPQGYRYAVTISGFAANSSVSVACHDSVSPGGFYTFSLATDTAGNGSTASQCYSGDGPDHWVIAGDVESNHVTWGSSAAPPPTPTSTPPTASEPVFTVMNTSETPPDGVWFRNSPHTGDTDRVTGHGVYSGEQVQLHCYAFGDSVGPYADSLWYYVTDVSRPTNNGVPNVGYLNAHYINDGKSANQIDAGVRAC